MELSIITSLIILCSILMSVYLSWTLNSKAYKAIDVFTVELEQSVIFKPSVKYNNKIYLIDKIKKWSNDDEAGNWLALEQSQGDLLTEFTVDKNKFIAIYKQADADA